MIPFLISLCFVAVLTYLYRSIPVDDPKLEKGPQELADELHWVQGKASPNGRRALHVRPAVSNLVSMTTDPGPYFAAGCPVNIEKLKGSLPASPKEIAVSWPLTEQEAQRVAGGFLPEVMEDKWRIASAMVGDARRAFFIRSWTGELVYVIEVQGSAVTSLWHPDGDALAEPMVRGLMDAYLFDKICVIPAPAELGDDKIKLVAHGMQWAGRHCDYVEPAAAPTPAAPTTTATTTTPAATDAEQPGGAIS